MDVSRDRMLRRFDMALQRNLHVIDAKVKIFSKNHKLTNRLLKKDLRNMIDSRRKMALGDLKARDDKKAIRIKREEERILKEKQRLEEFYASLRPDTPKDTDSDLNLPELLLPQNQEEAIPTPKRKGSIILPPISTQSTPRFINSQVPQHSEKENTKYTNTAIKSNRLPKIRDSGHQLFEENATDTARTVVNQAQNTSELMDVRSSKAKHRTPRTQRVSEQNNDNIEEENYAVPEKKNSKLSKWSYLSKSVKNSHKDLLNSDVTADSIAKNFSLPPIDKDFNRKTSGSSLGRDDCSQATSKHSSVSSTSKWRRLSVLQRQSGCRRRSSVADKAVRAFVGILQKSKKTAVAVAEEVESKITDLSYLKNCRYLRHPDEMKSGSTF